MPRHTARPLISPLATALLLGSGVLTPAPAPLAAQRAPTAAAAPATAAGGESFHGLFTVERHGKGRPMILIPGLTSGGSVWDGLVERYSDRYELHVLTLAGFAGVPPTSAPHFLAAERDGIIRYIREQGLERPVLVGHSLGGFLSFWVAASAPDLVGPVVAVDGVPFLVALNDTTATAASMGAQAASVRQMYASLTPDQMAMQGRMALAGMMRDTTHLAEAVEWSRTSDPVTAGRAVAEMLTTDLRDSVAAIRAPVLLIAAGGNLPDEQRETVRPVYEAQVARVPDHRVVVADAGHFVMYDAPDFLFRTMDDFLGSAAGGASRGGGAAGWPARSGVAGATGVTGAARAAARPATPTSPAGGDR